MWHSAAGYHFEVHPGDNMVGIAARTVVLEDILEEPNLLDRHLVRYVAAGRAATEGHSCFSLCTDKSTVCGLGSGVQNTGIVLPNNKAILTPPQVLQLTFVARDCVCSRLPGSIGKISRSRNQENTIHVMFFGTKYGNQTKNTPRDVAQPERNLHRMAGHGIDQVMFCRTHFS